MIKKQTFTTVLVILLSLFSLNAQEDDRKWTFGVNASTVIFGEEGQALVKDGLNTQFPSLQLSRKLGDKFSLDFIYTFEVSELIKGANAFNYSSFDAVLRYDLPELFLNIVPFGGIGFGYVSGATTTPDPQGSLSLNVMGGGTLWVTPRFGLTGRLTYKQISSNSESMASHVQGLAGMVYKFDMGSTFGNSRKRLWDMNH
jgi:hypothetical protein